jgi:hypothetical protein
MTRSHPAPTGDRILEPLIALARCSKQHRIVVAGSKSLNRRGFIHVASTANCGPAARQYDVAFVDRSPRQALRQDLYAGLKRRGFLIEDKAVHEFGAAISARRREGKPIPQSRARPIPNAKARTKDVVVIVALRVAATIAGLLLRRTIVNQHDDRAQGHTYHAGEYLPSCASL